MRARLLIVAALFVCVAANADAQTQPAPGTQKSTALDPMVSLVTQTWRREDRVIQMGPPRTLFRGDPFIAPRDLVRHGNALYVLDAGHPTDARQSARIIRIPLVNEQPGTPTIFFQRPEYLFSIKWAVPIDRDTFAIADQGKVINREFTGDGGKIFLLKIRPDGTHGEPRTLWEGLPFVCPTGIAKVGTHLIVTDPCAGPMRTRADAPDVASMTSSLFALPLSGGSPRLLWEGDPFVSLISISLESGGRYPQLFIADVDSGRIDRTGFEVRRSALAERDTRGVHRRSCTSLKFCAAAASSDTWVIDVISSRIPRIGPPRRFPVFEEGPVTMKFSGVPENADVQISTRDGARFRTGGTDFRFAARTMRDNQIQVMVASPLHRETVGLGVAIRDPSTKRLVAQAEFLIPKDLSQAPGINDYKNLKPIAIGGRRYFVSPDTALGRGAVNIIPREGGTFVTIARGEPFVRPFTVQTSLDGKRLWIIDESRALFELPVPDAGQLAEFFPPAQVRSR